MHQEPEANHGYNERLAITTLLSQHRPGGGGEGRGVRGDQSTLKRKFNVPVMVSRAVAALRW